MRRDIYRLPPITLLAILIEFAIILIASVNATSQFLNPDPTLKLPGNEGEWLTSSAQLASYNLRDYGYIGLWQPYLSRGEPLIDNPFSMVLNPISTIPTLIYGPNLGIRYSIVLTTIFAGLGGWALGRMLGFSSLCRVILALLLAGKGNMVGMIGAGYFQLGASQAYIPWVIAGTIGILRMKHRRFPVVLTAIMLTLMFWAGNIYFLLPTLMSVVGLTLTHILTFERENGQTRVRVDFVALRRMISAAILTVGLSAISFLPIFIYQGRIGGHPNESGAGAYAELGSVIRMFFNSSTLDYSLGLVPGGQEFYQSYVLPTWFAILIFIVLPPLGKRLHRSSMPKAWQIWVVGLFMIVFCLLWGSGQNPIVAWLYANVPLIGQWRFVGRMLGIVSFWIAVLAVMRLDGLWRAVILGQSWMRLPLIKQIPGIRLALLVVVAAVSFAAASSVMAQWKDFAGPISFGMYQEDECIEWLRDHNPDKYLSVWTLDYEQVTVFLENRVRHANISADFFVIADPPTLNVGDLTRLSPEYAMPWSDSDRMYMVEQGYEPVTDSPTPYNTNCVWRKPDAFSYAFTIPLADLKVEGNAIPVSVTTPISNYVQYPDRIALGVSASPDHATAVVVQEIHYPGWMVEVDGQPATLDSVGGLLGVVLPPGSGQHLVYFAYHPPLVFLGAMLTVLTAILCAGYLASVERYIPKRWQTMSARLMRRTARGAFTALTSPDLFEPRMPPDTTPLLPPGNGRSGEPLALGDGERDDK